MLGIGPVYAARIIAEIGKIECFETQAQLAEYAGPYWEKSNQMIMNGNEHLE